MSLADRLAALADAITVAGIGEAVPGPPVPVVTMRQSPVEHLQPYGPDPVVFGCPKPPLEERAYAVPVRTCRACQVQWAGDGPCWFCGQP